MRQARLFTSRSCCLLSPSSPPIRDLDLLLLLQDPCLPILLFTSFSRLGQIFACAISLSARSETEPLARPHLWAPKEIPLVRPYRGSKPRASAHLHIWLMIVLPKHCMRCVSSTYVADHLSCKIRILFHHNSNPPRRPSPWRTNKISLPYHYLTGSHIRCARSRPVATRFPWRQSSQSKVPSQLTYGIEWHRTGKLEKKVTKMPKRNSKRVPTNRTLFSHLSYRTLVYGKGLSRIRTSPPR